MELFRFNHQLTEDIVQKNAIYQIFDKIKFTRIMLLWIGPIIGLIGVVIMIVLQEASFSLIACSIFLLLLGPGMYIGIKALVRSQFRKNKALMVQNEIIFNDDMVEILSERGNSKLFYSDFTQIRQDKNLIYIYIGIGQCIPLSKEVIGAEIVLHVIKIFREKLGNKCKL